MDNGSTHDVDITVHTTGIAPSGNFVIRVAVVEAMVTYGSPPGNNGETAFPNVFRKFIANGTTGVSYTPAATGNSVAFNYSYTENAVWDETEIYVMAWVQNTSTKEIINSGTSLDAKWELNNFSSIFDQEASGNTSTFNAGVTNDGSASELFRITLTNDAPGDWAGDFTIGGNTYSSTADVTVTAATLENMTINVVPGATAGISKYSIELESLDDPSKPHQSMSYTVMSGITDLVITNGAEADLSESVFLNGLASAGNTHYDVMDASIFKIASSTSQIAGVNNLYYNVGWTFPCFDNAMVTELAAFMDNGGDVFMAGQDIAWSSYDAASPYVSTTVNQFLSSYFGIGYVGDGSSANSSMTPEAGDIIYGTANTMPLVDIHGGNMYPDQLSVSNSGSAIFYYNGNTSKIGAIRQQTTHKAAFFGIDMGMVQSAANGNAIIQISHDWFYGLLSNEEYDKAIANLTAYPNPTSASTTIEFNVLKSDATLNITDISGKQVFTSNLKGGSTQYVLNVSLFEAGTYFYTIEAEKGARETKKLQVIK